jgi:hypothetical protein
MSRYGIISNPHSPVWANAEKTIVNLCVTILGHNGEHYFTATADDTNSHSIALYADAISGMFGEIAEFVPLSDSKNENDVRFLRNSLLAATDWSQSSDVPAATRDKWLEYRQALRDIPQQSGFPNNIIWPTKPM